MIMEKVYKTMRSVAVFNIVVGIVTIITGALTGAFMIVHGGRLLSRKNDIMF